MKTAFTTKQQGSLKWIVIIIIGLIIASYFFDFSLQEAIEDEQTQSNWEYIKTNLVEFYEMYLREYVEIFVNFFVEYIWEPITENFESMGSGDTTEEQTASIETT